MDNLPLNFINGLHASCMGSHTDFIQAKLTASMLASDRWPAAGWPCKLAVNTSKHSNLLQHLLPAHNSAQGNCTIVEAQIQRTSLPCPQPRLFAFTFESIRKGKALMVLNMPPACCALRMHPHSMMADRLAHAKHFKRVASEKMQEREGMSDGDVQQQVAGAMVAHVQHIETDGRHQEMGSELEEGEIEDGEIT